MKIIIEDAEFEPVKLLVVDDSWVLRRVLRGTLSQREEIQIVGEATNGVEALDLVLKLQPDVILLDVEMPVMDGLTTLQHLMIHTPTPVIMLSSLSKWGSPRCFDALKYGATDFVSKNIFFQDIDGTAHSKLVVGKILAAAATTVSSVDPMRMNAKSASPTVIERVVFCEECGTRNSVKTSPTEAYSIRCVNCGDEITPVLDQRFRRMNYVSVIGAGKSSYGNLLKILPELSPDMGGALFITVLDEMEHVKSFVKYLDSISDFQVTVGENGVTVEGGFCYLFSGEQRVTLSPYSGSYNLKIENRNEMESEGIDTLMTSVSALLGDKVLGILLSGDNTDGQYGLKQILLHNGTALLLNPKYCLQKSMVDGLAAKYKIADGLDEFGLAAEIKKNHFLNKERVVTA